MQAQSGLAATSNVNCECATVWGDYFIPRGPLSSPTFVAVPALLLPYGPPVVLTTLKYRLRILYNAGNGKGGESMSDNQESKIVKAASRTYFLDFKQTRDDKTYLVITESRKVADDNFERHSISVFPEDAAAFLAAVQERVTQLA